MLAIVIVLVCITDRVISVIVFVMVAAVLAEGNTMGKEA